jgi:glycerophosphoryl diester phosphodiesterase
MKDLLLIVLIAGSLFFGAGCKDARRHAATDLHTVEINSLQELQAYFRYSPERDIRVSGHRGGMMPGYPENCIASCEKTLSLMPAMFEIDPQLTKDSVLVLMHDATIDRTTTGTGKVSDYTYEELRQFFLKDRQGKVTESKIPTLDEILAWGEGKTVFEFDNKKVPWEVYSKHLNGKWKKYHNIALYCRSMEELKYYYERNANAIFFYEISSWEKYEEFNNSDIPWNRIVAYVRNTMDPGLQEVYDLIHSHGTMCQIAIAPTTDKVEPMEAKTEAYREQIACNPDIIETDYPVNLVGLSLKRTKK